MAVREFNGSSDVITFDHGIVGAFNNNVGGMSMVMVVKSLSNVGSDGLFDAYNAGTGLMAIYCPTTNDPSALEWGSDSPGADVQSSNTSMLDAGNWQVIGMDKASGTATPRFHSKILGSGSFVHSNGTATVATSATSCVNFKVGAFKGPTGWFNCRIAVAAFFTSQLTDTDYVNIESNATTTYLNSLGPVALWDFNQASTGTNVPDLTGNGADQTAITGTTVATTDDPAWTFGLSGGGSQTILPDADTTTTGWTTTPLFSKVNDSSDATIIQATLS